jgi:hypothetical protein
MLIGSLVIYEGQASQCQVAPIQSTELDSPEKSSNLSKTSENMARQDDSVVWNGVLFQNLVQHPFIAQRNPRSRVLDNAMIDNTNSFINPTPETPSLWRGWFSFAAGSVVAFLVLYVGYARPAVEELSLLRNQIRSLEKSVSLIAGQRDGVDETNHLLGQLSQLQSQALTARKTLVDLREMTQSLVAESSRFQEATHAIHQLASIKDQLLKNAEDLDQAADAMAANEALQQRLTNSAEANETALRASLDLLAIRSELLQDVSLNSQAKGALNNLLQLRESLANEHSRIDVAQERINGLINLKDSVIAQTDNLSESIETLELTNELSDRFRIAANSFKEIRDWMIEMVAMEPTFAQVRRILEPMADLVNLNRMDPKQIRDFTRAFVQQSQERLAKKPSSVVSLRSTTDESSISSKGLQNATND